MGKTIVVVSTKFSNKDCVFDYFAKVELLFRLPFSIYCRICLYTSYHNTTCYIHDGYIGATPKLIELSGLSCMKHHGSPIQSRTFGEHVSFLWELSKWYCGWKKSCITLDVWKPIDIGTNHLSTGAGFLPSTVCWYCCGISEEKAGRWQEALHLMSLMVRSSVQRRSIAR